MIYEFKLIPLNRKTGQPALEPTEVEPQITVDIEKLYRTLDVVNPRASAGLLPALVLTEDDDVRIFIGSVAKALSEMYGADIYYHEQGQIDWQYQASLWQPSNKRK